MIRLSTDFQQKLFRPEGSITIYLKDKRKKLTTKNVLPMKDTVQI